MSPILEFVLLTVAIIGGWMDLRTRRIPNWLNLSGVILGIGLNALFSHEKGFKLAITGLGLALLIYVPLYLIRAMGAGDVKFMAAIGALVGLAGGVLHYGDSGWNRIALLDCRTKPVGSDSFQSRNDYSRTAPGPTAFS